MLTLSPALSAVSLDGNLALSSRGELLKFCVTPPGGQVCIGCVLLGRSCGFGNHDTKCSRRNRTDERSGLWRLMT